MKFRSTKGFRSMLRKHARLSGGLPLGRRHGATIENLEERRLLADVTLGQVVLRNPGTTAQWNVTNRNGTSTGSPTDSTETTNLFPGLGVLDARTNSTQSDAFDTGHSVYVGDRLPGGDPSNQPVFSPFVAPSTVHILGIQSNATDLATDAVGMQGLRVTMQYHVSANRAILRTLAEFRNPTAAAITVPVAWVYNLGSASGLSVPPGERAVVVSATSSGDSSFDVTDRWIVTRAPAFDGVDRPAVTGVLYGPNRPRVTPYAVSTTVYNRNGSDGVLAYYLVNVPAGAMRSLMFFTQMSNLAGDESGDGQVIPGSALDTVGSFDSNAALSDAAQSGDNLLSGLEAADLRRVVNWRFGSPPVAVADSYGVDEDGTLVVDAGHGVLSNDSDPDGDAITTLLLTHPANGTLTLSADGSFSYTPNADYFGTDGFTYQARDASGSLSSETTVTITVNAVNDAPIARRDVIVTDEDVPVTVNLLANDRPGPANERDQTLTVTRLVQPDHGHVEWDASGTVTYTPDPNYNGPDSFAYFATDDGDPAATDRAAGIVTINPVNDAPVADDGHAVTDEDVPVRIDLRDFVHDVETAPDDLTYEIVDPPAARKGELVERIRNGVFLFRPADNFYGTAAFTFHVTDTGDPAGSGEAVLSSNDAVFRIRIRSVNDAPVAHAGRDVGGTTLPPADEGAVVEFHGRGEDVEDAPEALTYRWDFGDGNHADTAEATNTYADDGVYYATLTVIDTEGAVDTDTRMIVVNNVAPTATLSNSAPVDEGSGASVGFGAAFDPSASDTAAGFTYSFDFDNDGTFEVADGESPTADVPAALLAAGPAVRTVRARIADKDGGSTDYTTDVTVLNVAPSVSAGGDGAADEGGPFTRTGSFTDPGADAWAATVDYGDGSGAIALDLNADKTFTLQHTYADDGQYTVLVTVRDGDSASGDEVVVTVANVSPTAEITGAPEGDSPEGAAVAFGSAASDPAGADDPLSYTWSVTRDGNAFPVGDAASPDLAFTPDDNGTYVVTLTVDDGDGGMTTVSRTLSVTNVAPAVAPIAGPDAGVTGQALSYSASFTDAGTNDTHTANIDWGDGTAITPAAVTETVGSGSGSVAASHAYAAPGVYTISLTVRDDDGGSQIVTRGVDIKGAALQPDPCYPGKMALYVVGTAGNDLIELRPATQSGSIEVVLNGASLGTFAPTGRVVIYAGAGDDTVLGAGAVSQQTWMYGEQGNDTLNLGNGGGIAFGGVGNDQMNGGSGRDILLGGEGADRIVSNPGDDILISCITRYDDRFSAVHEQAWCSIYSEWSNTVRTFRQRVDNVRDGSGTATRLNGPFYLNDSTVDDDTAVDIIGTQDVLTGAAGEDWFIYKFGEDKITSMSSTEASEDLLIH